MDGWMDGWIHKWMRCQSRVHKHIFTDKVLFVLRPVHKEYTFRDYYYTSLLNSMHIVLSSTVFLFSFTSGSVFLDLKVEVYVNGIPAKCSGDCGFTWDPMTTPIVLTVTPSEGNILLLNLEYGWRVARKMSSLTMIFKYMSLSRRQENSSS